MFYRIFLSLNVTNSKAESIPSFQNPPYNTNHAEARVRHPCLSSHAVIISESNTSNKIKNDILTNYWRTRFFNREKAYEKEKKKKKQQETDRQFKEALPISFSLPYISF